MNIIGETPAIRELKEKISDIAPTDCIVLVQGETGSGKELVARALHRLSTRQKYPFVVLNCAAIAENLIETELFGHEKGAFTGAHAKREGAFEAAHEGTLFLDEVGDLPLALQPKLLRVLEDGAIKRVGGNKEIDVDVRVIAATHHNLADKVRRREFREDLCYRLHVIPIAVPPLRERIADIPLLAEHFTAQILPERGKKQLSPSAIIRLMAHSWPGNVRELKNVILRGWFRTKGEIIEADKIEFLTIEERLHLVLAEKGKIEVALRATGWNKTRAASMLGIAKSTLFRKIKGYGMARVTH